MRDVGKGIGPARTAGVSFAQILFRQRAHDLIEIRLRCERTEQVLTCIEGYNGREWGVWKSFIDRDGRKGSRRKVRALLGPGLESIHDEEALMIRTTCPLIELGIRQLARCQGQVTASGGRLTLIEVDFESLLRQLKSSVA